MSHSVPAVAVSSLGLLLCALLGAGACSSSSGSSAGPGPDAGPGGEGGQETDASGDSTTGSTDSGSTANDTGAADAPAEGNGPIFSDGGFLPTGWLYTSGAKIYVSNGAGGTPWMGRGVNLDDIFLCGYDNTLWMTNPDQTLETIAAGLVSAWKPSFVRISLGMASNTTTVSWLTNPAQYATPMTNVIKAIGKNPGVYVLVTLRSDSSMIKQVAAPGDSEATGLPSDSTTTPDKTKYPTGTDAVYQALVDAFASDGFVLFGLSNEPGGSTLSSATVSAAMSHAVGVIRAEENKLGVPHHVVSVQGSNWTSDISGYATTPLAYDNVVYEVHGYPPPAASYTYANIPVILGEYGSLTDSTTFYADVESKQIPNLAWDFEPYSNCSPDLLNVNQSATNLSPTAWGQTVQAYLLAH